jgi:GNAT superfamily N-acetyltransferase
MHYRLAGKSDIPAMACMRALQWGTEEYWRARISGYLDGQLHPRQALLPRISYVALAADSPVGFIAGHLTRRYGCDGELEWIDVIPEHRGSGVAPELLRLLAAWFVGRNAFRICVDVDPTNSTARRFYLRQGANNLNEHWLVWNDIKHVLGKRRSDGKPTV